MANILLRLPFHQSLSKQVYPEKITEMRTRVSFLHQKRVNYLTNCERLSFYCEISWSYKYK